MGVFLVRGVQSCRMLYKLKDFLKYPKVSAAVLSPFFQGRKYIDKLNNDSQKVWLNRKVVKQNGQEGERRKKKRVT